MEIQDNHHHYNHYKLDINFGVRKVGDFRCPVWYVQWATASGHFRLCHSDAFFVCAGLRWEPVRE
jgi:hypothetical protein